MRDLILMRGLPGSGKTTWIASMGLQDYVISPDRLRLMYLSPCHDWRTGDESISQDANRQVWNQVKAMADYRMSRGCLTVIDAVAPDFDYWRQQAEKHRYRVWVKCMDTPLDECLRRNLSRGLHKVPESVIMRFDRALSSQRVPKSVLPVPEDLLDNERLLVRDTSRHTYVFGDIHGCYEPLAKFFADHPVSDEDTYLFVGDYLDRGPQNREVLEFLSRLASRDNFIFLEGNHRNEMLYSSGRGEEIRSREFLTYTKPQIEALPAALIRRFCRRWSQLSYFEKAGKRFLVTHAGLGYMPGCLARLSADEIIRGGSYEDDVDREWSSKHTGVIQIHGHRNLMQHAMDAFPDSINLCWPVEYGGSLRVLDIGPDGSLGFLEIPNGKVTGRPDEWGFSKRTREKSMLEDPSVSDSMKLMIRLREDSKRIREKPQDNGLSSFNFTRDVFQRADWDELSTVARGLFMDTRTGDIAARSYPKFFGVGEGSFNRTAWLKDNLKFPVWAYRKYNGFLGILSARDHGLLFCTKSTCGGPYVEIFRSVFESFFSESVRHRILEHLDGSGKTLLFEVMDPVRDPHIIEYDAPGMVLLDELDNTVGFSRLCYPELAALAQRLGVPVKVCEGVFMDFNTLKWFIDEGRSRSMVSAKPIEGWVLEDVSGYMVKLKTPYYLKWKAYRSVKERMARGSVPEQLDEVSHFFSTLPQEKLAALSIIELRKMYEAAGQNRSEEQVK